MILILYIWLFFATFMEGLALVFLIVYNHKNILVINKGELDTKVE